MWTNDKIILLKDISAPPPMAGVKGDVKVIDIDIPLYYAKSAVRGGHARQVADDAGIREVKIELGLIKPEPKPEKKTEKRKEKTDGGKGTDSGPDKGGDNKGQDRAKEGADRAG